MYKRLRLEKICDKLAEEMWGEIYERIELSKGLIYYRCKYYKGFIFNDRNLSIEKELRLKLDPMIILEEYSFRKERYIIERTDADEKIPEKLLNKYNNTRYDDRICIYALAEKSMDILLYYHSDILKHEYINKINHNAKKFNTSQGFINSERRRILKELALNSPEFIKKKDKKKARELIKKQIEKELKIIKSHNNNISDEMIEDLLAQKIEVLSS